MTIVLSLLLILLGVASVSVQSYFMFKHKEFKPLVVQGGILVVAMVLGVIAILRLSVPSIAKVMVEWVPRG